MSLFGEPRAIGSSRGDEIADAVDAVLTARPRKPGDRIAGALRKTSALLKLSEGDSMALTHASYRRGPGASAW